MPNWYSGTVTIRGDIHEFLHWYEEKKHIDNGLENNFAQTFAPLSSGEWDFGTACQEWGVKWDLSNIYVNNASPEEFSFSFDTAWNSPIYLWKQLELRYNVEVEEIGYEEQQLEFYKYHRGRIISKNVDDDWFVQNLNFIPSKDAIMDPELMEDEKMEFKYDNWCDGLHLWNSNLKNENINWRNVSLCLDKN